MQVDGFTSRETPANHIWALILAGGEGTRLRQLTTTGSGTAVPKQFCSLAGGHTLLEEAITRARGVTTDEHICTVVTDQHRRWWSALLADQPAENVIVQPHGRGTGVGILYSVLHIAVQDPQARIVVLPSDHHVLDEQVLRTGLQRALSLVDQDERMPVLVGLEPERVDRELGYILPGTADDSGARAVARFIEKPDFTLANTIVGEGGLWNTFILASSAQALVNLFMGRFSAIALEMQVIVSRALGMNQAGGAWPSLVDLYQRLPCLDFSKDLLQGNERSLRVLRVPDCGWSDLGTPVRVGETLRRLPPERSHARRTTPFVNLAAQHALYERDRPSPSL